MHDVPTLTTVTVRYFAAARAAAGVESERIDVRAGGSVADVLDVIRSRHDGELTRVLERCSFLLDEMALRDRATEPAEGATLDVLPPFAGG